MDQVTGPAPRLPRRRTALRAYAPQRQEMATATPVLRPPTAEAEGLAETLRKLWRHRRLILASTVVLGGAAVFAAWMMPSYYVSEARVLVGIQAPRVLNVEAILADTSPDAERVQNEGFILQSRSLARKVIDQLKLQDNPEFNPGLRQPSIWARAGNLRNELPEPLRGWLGGLSPAAAPAAPSVATPLPDASDAENRLIDAVLAHIDVSTLGRSHVLSLKADAREPKTAANLANAFAEQYLEQARREKINSMDRVDKFLMTRIAELRDQVKKSDQAVEDYRRNNDLYKSTGSGVTAQQLTELNSQLLSAQTAKAEADARLAEAQELRKGGLGNESVPEVLRSPLISALKQQLADAERRAAEMSASLNERHPSMIKSRAEVANLQGRLGSEVGKIVDGLAREARTAAARYDSLSRNFDQLKHQMGAVNDKSIQLEALERDATVNRNLLEAMLVRAKQTIGAENILEANAKLVSPAAPPQAASYPPKSLIALLGIAGGLMVGAAIALMRESGDRTFRRADQVEGMTGLPVIAMVPQLSGRTPPAMQVLRQPTSVYSEALRRLQIGIELSEAADSPRTIMFSSATPSEGKSVMAASLGRLLASNGKRVLLIDCDWRSPRLHQIFRCGNRNGLINILDDAQANLTDVIHHDALSGLDIMPAGPWNPRSAHLLGSERMRHLLEALTEHYEFVLLDTAPALVTADGLALSRMVEKVLFVVRWGHTRQENAIDALKQIIDAQGDVAGIVMSRVVSKQYKQYGYIDPFHDKPRQGRAQFGQAA